MKALIFLIACISFVACNPPANGDGPNQRDSIGDPIDPADTAANHLDPDSTTRDPKVEW